MHPLNLFSKTFKNHPARSVVIVYFRGLFLNPMDISDWEIILKSDTATLNMAHC